LGEGVFLALIGERRGAYRIRWGILLERANLEDVDVEGKIILKWIYKE